MSDDTFDTPAAVEAAFYKAFTNTDIERMAGVWAQETRILCIHPGGDLLRGKTAVIRSWLEVFANSDPPVIEYRLIGNFEASGLAVHLVEERIRPRGMPTESPNRVMATNVFVREGVGWRLVEHHASLPLIARREPEREPSRLH